MKIGLRGFLRRLGWAGSEEFHNGHETADYCRHDDECLDFRSLDFTGEPVFKVLQVLFRGQLGLQQFQVRFRQGFGLWLRHSKLGHLDDKLVGVKNEGAHVGEGYVVSYVVSSLSVPPHAVRGTGPIGSGPSTFEIYRY